jgi:acyl-CoA synthetase (AMP-forming)/AMP-acid ligase II
MTSTGFVNIASHLGALAQSQPYTRAVVYPFGRDRFGRVSYTHYTYQQLDAESDRLAHALEERGVQRGVRTVLMVPPSLEFFALTFALFKIGAIPVLVDPGMGVANLGQCLREAKPAAFIGVPKAHIARALLGWARTTIKTLVTVGKRAPWGGATLAELLTDGGSSDGGSEPFAMADTGAEETAAILFTSGSTGVPKGAVYTHGVFAAQVESVRAIYGIEPGEIDLPTFPLFALFAPALGMTAVLPDMDPTRPANVDPLKIFEAIRDFGVTNIFGSPALIRRVGEYGAEHGVRLKTLRRVISAGAPVPANVLERFVSMLEPGVQVFTPYGATESLPVASIGSDEILGDTRKATDAGRGVCVGQPVPGMDVRVIRISDEPIAQWNDDLTVGLGEIGEIVVRGPVVTHEYFNRPESTLLSKIHCQADGSFFHRMGDLGYFDPSGRLWFCGRKSQRVATANETLFTVPCEAVFNTHPEVFRSALVPVRRRGTTEPVLCVELEKNSRIPSPELTSELLELGESQKHTSGISTVLFHPSFPVDIRHNAKIFREKLSTWAQKQLS